MKKKKLDLPELQKSERMKRKKIEILTGLI